MAKTTIKPKGRAKAPTRKKTQNPWLAKLSSLAKRPFVLLAIFVVLVGVVGGYAVVNRSDAAVSYLSYNQCYLRGRMWNSTATNPCLNKCYPPNVSDGIAGAGSLVYTTPYNYCSAAVSKASSTTTTSKCASLNRVWVSYIGCARDWTRRTDKYYVRQCTNPNTMIYVPASGTNYDRCYVYTAGSM